MTLTIVAWVFGWAVLHLGHSVTVAGSRTHESMAREKADEKKEGQVEKASGTSELWGTTLLAMYCSPIKGNETEHSVAVKIMDINEGRPLWRGSKASGES